MDSPKIMLSQEELVLVQNSDWILTKQGIIEKVYQMFGGLATQLQLHLRATEGMPAIWLNSFPKIARGEQYQQLPYVMLDYPRYFDKENILAIRTFFWWGRFFSCTLHVKGAYRLPVAAKIISHYQTLVEKDLFVGLGKDEWRHDFEAAHCQPLKNASQQEWEKRLGENDFIKLAAKIPLAQWESAQTFLNNIAYEFILLLQEKAMHQCGEKDL